MSITEQSQGDLFKERGMTRVSQNNSEWLDRAEMAFRNWLQTQISGEVSADIVREVVIFKGAGRPSHPNAWGALARRLLLKNAVVPTGRFVKSKHPEAHSRMVPVYRIKGGLQ